VDETDPFLTVDEVGAMLRLNPRRGGMIDRGELAAVRVGSRRARIRRSALDQFIAENAAMMGPNVEDARTEFDGALEAVQPRLTTASWCRRSSDWPRPPRNWPEPFHGGT
jgi:excisionase family DNA binding protein